MDLDALRFGLVELEKGHEFVVVVVLSWRSGRAESAR
jgi:hypothetical protein